MAGLDHRVLGSASGKMELSTSAENREIALALAGQATLSVDIVSRHLDPPVYDQVLFIEAVKRMVLEHRMARVRMLVRDIQPILSSGHRLAHLAARLSTFLEIRVPAEQHKDFNQALMIVDGTGYIHRELADRYEAVADFADRGRASDLQRKFEEMWAIATQDPNLRQMRI